MRISFHPSKIYKLQPEIRRHDYSEHCKYGYGPEYRGYQYHSHTVILRSRVHKNRYQWFAWPENKYSKQYPWRYIHLAFFRMQMHMSFIMRMGMRVLL